jgi:hypothetical protein
MTSSEAAHGFNSIKFHKVHRQSFHDKIDRQQIFYIVPLLTRSGYLWQQRPGTNFHVKVQRPPTLQTVGENDSIDLG